MYLSSRVQQNLLTALVCFLIQGCFVFDSFTEADPCFFGKEQGSDACEIPREISAGNAHTCVIRQSGGVACWGSNEFGQLGAETGGQRILASYTPRELSVREVEQLSSGHRHTCAINDGELYCWGDNRRGQVGVPFTDLEGQVITLPTQIVMNSTVASTPQRLEQVTAGGNHTCVLTRSVDGSMQSFVYCWGDNSQGQVDANSSEPYFVKPQLKTELRRYAIEKLSAGLDHTCAHDGTNVLCWGNPSSGKTGRLYIESEARYEETEPKQIAQTWGVADRILDISAGYQHSCALIQKNGEDVAGQIYCWGSSKSLQFAPFLVTTSTNSNPLRTDTGVSMNALVAGRYHTCVLGDDLQTYCWGGNQNYQLGDGTDQARENPEPVAGEGVDLVRLSVGGEHACGIMRKTGEVRCWGLNSAGQAGQAFEEGESGSQRTVKSPTPITLPDARDSDAGTVVQPEDAGTLIEDTGMSETDAGTVTSSDAGTMIDAGSSTVSMDAGMVIMDAEVSMDAAVHPDATPQDSGVSPDASQPDAGQIADAGTPDSGTSGSSALVMDISAGTYHACAVVDASGGSGPPTNEVWCWGEANNSGFLSGHFGPNWVSDSMQLDTYAQPYNTGVTGITSVHVGTFVTCGVTTNRGATCWGSIGSNQLLASSMAPDGTPLQIDFGMLGGQPGFPPSVGLNDDARIIDMCVGREHACVLHDGGPSNNNIVTCWGSNEFGQAQPSATMFESTNMRIQNPSSTNPIYEPDIVDLQTVFPTSEPVQVTCGAQHTCVRDSGGQVACWGANLAYELGRSSQSVWAGIELVQNVSNSKDIKAGRHFTCSMDATDEDIVCWGLNDSFQLGLSFASSVSTSTMCARWEGGWLGYGFPEIINDVQFSSQSMNCAPVSSSGQADRLVEFLPPFDMLSRTGMFIGHGAAHACVSLASSPDSAKCWGSGHGNIGTSQFTMPTQPTAPNQPYTIEKLTAGSEVTCGILETENNTAMTSEFHVYCWGCPYTPMAGPVRMMDCEQPVRIQF